MRRKTKTGNATDSLAKPGQGSPFIWKVCSSHVDIRTLYVVFILSFVETDNSASIKAEFLEQHRDVFLSIFKGLFQDSYAVVSKVLEVCWAGIWSDLKLKRTLKISLFNELTLSHVCDFIVSALLLSQILSFRSSNFMIE
jgi:nucleolar pre-ribosomal-associated protein 1